MTAPKEIIRLVENFERHRDEYHAAAYKGSRPHSPAVKPTRMESY
jgi:hypothetical protein